MHYKKELLEFIDNLKITDNEFVRENFRDGMEWAGDRIKDKIEELTDAANTKLPKIKETLDGL